MEKSILLRRGLFSGLLLWLIFPLMNLLFHLPAEPLRLDPLLPQVLKGSLLQTSLSVVVTMILAIMASFGLIFLRAKVNNSAFRFLLLLGILPSLLPPIITVVLGARALNGLWVGLWGVVFFHSLMNIGLGAVIFYQLIGQKAQSWVESAIVFGVSPFRLITKVFWREFRQDLLVAAFYFVILFFFSFSIPFLVGGVRFGGVEVYIYEKVIFLGQWSQAVYYSLLFFAVLLASSLLLNRGDSPKVFFKPSLGQDNLSYLGSFFGAIVYLSPCVFLMIGLVKSLVTTPLWPLSGQVQLAILGSLSLGLLAGLSVFVFLSVLSFCFLSTKANSLFNAVIHPGWIVVGFSLLLLPGDSVLWGLLKTASAIAILYIPFLLRISFSQRLSDLQHQVEIASTMPTSWSKVFLQVIWPQCLPSISLLSGLTGLWACGDFAITGILFSSQRSTTLAYEMQILLSSYRLDEAISLLLPLLVVCCVVFVCFQGFIYVSGRQTSS